MDALESAGEWLCCRSFEEVLTAVAAAVAVAGFFFCGTPSVLPDFAEDVEEDEGLDEVAADLLVAVVELEADFDVEEADDAFARRDGAVK